jgi:glycosyltransferase involved in cell wall biosynthesis
VKISVITPSLNQGQYLPDCIASVHAQTDVTIEHIIMDGGSTDATVAELKRHSHLRWRSEADNGQSDAINKGLRLATGDWAMWLNADDILLPGALQAVAECARRAPKADVIYGDCDFVDRDGRVVGHKREGDFSFWMLLLYGTYIPSTATFFRRRLWECDDFLATSYKVNMDLELYLRLAAAGHQFQHLPATLACFRWHETNVSHRHRERAHAEFRQLQRQYLRQRGLGWLGGEPALAAAHAGCRAFRWCRQRLARSTTTRLPVGTQRSGWWDETHTCR